ncbi:disease resistance protein RGA1 [Canna indica]|uniref:Disease resistance protein RGA1 n=1 Tax=Canna indica TaxID=4628 RepID=A0AAQ3QJP1_9LILI|nr:disease resistance protein RGA1 [Canna indica]
MLSFTLKAVGWLTDNFFGSLIGKVAKYTVDQFCVQHGLQDDLNKLRTSLLNTKLIINMVDNMQIKDEDLKNGLTELLLKLKDAAYDADDLIDEFQYRELQHQFEQQGDEASNISSISSSIFPPSKKIKTSISSVTSRLLGRGENDDDDVTRVRKIKERLDSITAEIEKVANFSDAYGPGRGANQMMRSVNRSTSSVMVETQVFGREKEINELTDLLVKAPDASDFNNQNISVLTIVGIGGLGKTTLAQIAYNDKRVEEHFQIKGWVCVSENFSVERLTKDIIESVTKEKCDLTSLDALQMVLKQKIESKKILLVLDDVWNEDKHKWESLCAPLRSGAPGSKIVVTTRSLKIAKIVGDADATHLECLDAGSSWAFFKKCAFGSEHSGNNPQLETIAKKILPKLKGLPLAMRSIGGLLNANMDDKHWKMIMESEIWQLPQDENGVLPVLQLSYQHLPADLKRCFSLCSLFPKDFEFYEPELVGLWMAEGSISCQGNMRMEDIGSNYFHDLVGRSFFQKLKYGRYLPLYASYMMHDLMHDLAESISVAESYRVDIDKLQEIPNTLRHLSICNEGYMQPKLKEFLGYNKLWTLVLHNRESLMTCMLSCGLFEKLKSIRVLILRDCGLKELPASIGNLIHLRYLDISDNDHIRKLPDSLCGLYNLQTLIVGYGMELLDLPGDMHKLINMRKFVASNKIISMLTEVGKLTSLQELSTFKVLKDDGHRLVELNGLRQLHGGLRITNLENVGSEEEASSAKLKDKEYLDALTLEWTPSWKDNAAVHVLHEVVLEGLQPHHALRRLGISGYNGAKFPSWMESELLPNLVGLKLILCQKWEDLSFIGQFSHLEKLVLQNTLLLEEFASLGQLPCLKVLEVGGMPHLRKMNQGLTDRTNQGKCFPRLKRLYINDMEEWEEWTWTEGVELFPCLSQLDVQICPKLEMLPPLPCTLTKLYLFKVGLTELPQLREEIDGSSRQTTLSLSFSIKECPNLRNLERGLLSQHLPNIKKIKIKACRELLWLPVKRFKELTSLESLRIIDCPKLIVSMTEDENLELPPSIWDLTLSNCGNLPEPLLGCLHMLTSLENLCIRQCPNIVSFRMKSLVRLNWLTLDYCNELKSIEGFRVKSLFHLRITGCPKLLLHEEDEQGESSSLYTLVIDETTRLKLSPLRDTLPSIKFLHIESSSEVVMFEEGEMDLLPSLTSLRGLKLRNCMNLRTLPTELNAIPSLEYFEIGSCPLVQALPEKGLPSSLRNLRFSGCHEVLTEQLSKHLDEMKSSGSYSEFSHLGLLDTSNLELCSKVLSSSIDSYTFDDQLSH